MDTTLSRRSFVKWGTVTAGAATLAGFTGCTSEGEEATDEVVEVTGEWKTGACMSNCSCTSSRCLLKVYVEDGVPLKIRTDEFDEDSTDVMQRRACLRGRAQISNVTSPARNKYPMKRKNWSPDNPNGELRGKDEWERISWEEALDYIADEMQKAYDTWGHKSIFWSGYGDIGDTYFDPIYCLFNAKGGALQTGIATISLGAWPAPSICMLGSMNDAPDYYSVQESELHIHFGNNWMANKGGNAAYQLNLAREAGGKLIIIDPWLNQTAQALADEWIPIRPGTDTAFAIGLAYHMIENDLQDQDYLDTYCVGFDADHMPEGAEEEESYKDYVLGTYDGEPKTPEWAEAICGVPAERIRSLAEEIASTEKVNFFAGQSTTKIPAGEMFAQAFYTLAFMHGGIGSSGNYVSWVGLHEGMSPAQYVVAGNYSNRAENPTNPLTPVPASGAFSVPDFEANEDWDTIDYTEGWQSILDGEYGRDEWPGGKKPIDIHVICAAGYLNGLNQNPNTNAAIEVYRSVDFAWGADPFFDPSRQHCDIVLPVTTWWEKGNLAWTNSADTLYWADQVIEPLFEAMPETYIVEELATRLGVDLQVVNTATDSQRTFNTLVGASYMVDQATAEYAPLLTITQEDIDEYGVESEPQEGLMTIAELKEKGLYKTQRQRGDSLTNIPFSAFYSDPVANPLPTASGKFEIYCQSLATVVNSLCYSTISPIAKWQMGDSEQGWGAQTDEYPLLLWTPHSLRRAHSSFDSVTSLREACPQECFISEIDAEARGISNGDPVLMTSPYGQVLRPAKIMSGVIPGAVALQDGAWTRIDEETGVDMGGNPNILQAPKASGQGSQSWTGTIVQVEKYTGDLVLGPDKLEPIVMPVGVE